MVRWEKKRLAKVRYAIRNLIFRKFTEDRANAAENMKYRRVPSVEATRKLETSKQVAFFSLERVGEMRIYSFI